MAWILVIPLLLSSISPAHAATGCSYPSSLDTWANKASGDNLTQGDLNSRTCAIEKLESGPIRPSKAASCSTPAYSFQGDSNTGIDSLAGDQVDICAGGSSVAKFTSSGLQGLTLDAEASNNVITVPVKFTIPLAGCNNATPGPTLDLPTSNALAATCQGTSPHRFATLDAADGANALTAAGHFVLPSDWSGAIDFKATAFSSSTSTNNFVTTLQTVCAADGEDVLNPTYNTAQTITKANNASANTRNSVTLTGVTTTGCAAGETFFFKVGRDPTNASDTLAATVSYMDIEFTIRRAM